jgi:hypothetical protein
VRQASFRWYFTVIMALSIAILSGIPIPNTKGNTIAGFGLPIVKTAVSDQIGGLLDYTEPLSDNPDIAFRANLVPTPNNGLINPRQNLPVWERVLVTKQARVMLGFFFAIMVIALFFIYYRNSRNVSEEDDDNHSGMSFISC